MNWVTDLAMQYKPQAGEANLFGVVIFADRHVHVKKMLADEDYWKALDEFSGPRWAVFATRAAQGRSEMSAPGRGILGMMRSVWKEPKQNAALLQAFELDSTKDLPALVIFVEDPHGRVLSTFIKIDDESEAAAYKSLKESLVAVAGALDFMYDHNRRIDVRAYELASERIQQLKHWRFLKEAFNVLERLKSVLT